MASGGNSKMLEMSALEEEVYNCKKCKGINECNRYCVIHAGKALYDLINRVNVIETRIGETDRSRKGGSKDLIVSGHQIWDQGSPSWILTDIKTTLDINPKFNGVFGKNPTQLITEFCKKNGIESEDMYKTIEMLSNINSNKLLIVPFKVNTQCSVDVVYTLKSGSDNSKDTEVKEKRKDCVITNIKWMTDRERPKLQCIISFRVRGQDKDGQVVKYDIKEYANKFRVSSIEMQVAGSEYNNEILKVTDSGLFKPIEIKYKDTIVAIDGTYLYFSNRGNVRIIGEWDAKGRLVLKEDTDKKIEQLKMINKNLIYIRNHRNYIAPYMLFKANTVEM